MSRATAGIILNPRHGDRFAFTENATLVANQDHGVFMILPDGRRIDLGEPVEDMKPVLVSQERIFFSRSEEQ